MRNIANLERSLYKPIYKKIKLVTFITSAMFFLFVDVSFSAPLPEGGSVVWGNAVIEQNPNKLTINQTSEKSIIEWKSFDLDANYSVEFKQPSNNSSSLNRVMGDVASTISGKIISNGKVFLVNPNGILFTKTGVVDTNAFTASSLNMQNDDFLNHEYIFTKDAGKPNALIENLGKIKTNDGGFVALLGGAVNNDGIITAHLGKVGIGAGEKIVMSFSNNGFLQVEIATSELNFIKDSNGKTLSEVINNQGEIQASAGLVKITTASAQNILRQVVNISGIINVGSVSTDGGTIILSGGRELTVNGKLDASGLEGGIVDIGFESILGSPEILAVGSAGSGGTVSLNAKLDITVPDIKIDTSAKNGGRIAIVSGGDFITSGKFSANGTALGGIIDLTSDGGLISLLNANVSARGESVGGRVRVGGQFQGGTPNKYLADEMIDSFVNRWNYLSFDQALPASQKTSIGNGSKIDVSSTQNGGTVIIYSAKDTYELGNINASGDEHMGGSIEVSGKVKLSTPDNALINAGSGGNVLIDSKDVNIGEEVFFGELTSISNRLFERKVAISGNGKKLASIDSRVNIIKLYSIEDDLSLTFDAYIQNTKDGRLATIVAIEFNEDGSLLVSGNSKDINKGVYLFDTSDSKNPVLLQKISNAIDSELNTHIDLVENIYFASAVALNSAGDKLAVGQTPYIGNGKKYGSVYLFDISDPLNPKLKQRITNSNGHNITNIALDENERFGVSVEFDSKAERLAVGSNYKSIADSRVSEGKIYLFSVNDEMSNVVLKNTLVGGAVKQDGIINITLDNSERISTSMAFSKDGRLLAIQAFSYDTYIPSIYLLDLSADMDEVAIKYRLSGYDNSDTNYKVPHFSTLAFQGFGRQLQFIDEDSQLIVATNNVIVNFNFNFEVGDLSKRIVVSLNEGTNLTIISSSDIIISSDIDNSAEEGKGALTLIAAGKINLDANVKINGALRTIANHSSLASYYNSDGGLNNMNINGFFMSGGVQAERANAIKTTLLPISSAEGIIQTYGSLIEKIGVYGLSQTNIIYLIALKVVSTVTPVLGVFVTGAIIVAQTTTTYAGEAKKIISPQKPTLKTEQVLSKDYIKTNFSTAKQSYIYSFYQMGLSNKIATADVYAKISKDNVDDYSLTTMPKLIYRRKRKPAKERF